MARIRTIKPEFWTSEQVMGLKPVTRLLFIGMWNFADDYGRMAYAPGTIKAQVMPSDNVSVAEVNDMLAELSAAKLILVYSAGGKDYIEVTGWSHQKIDKPHKPKFPAPNDEGSEIVAEPSPNIPRTFAEPSPSPPRAFDEPSPLERKGREIYSEANASDADASPRDLLWSQGLPALIALGVSEKQARPMIGRWLKECRDDHSELLRRILRAREVCPAEPIGWITQSLKRGQDGKAGNVIVAADRIVERLAAFNEPAPRELRGGESAAVVRAIPGRASQ